MSSFNKGERIHSDDEHIKEEENDFDDNIDEFYEEENDDFVKE